MKILAINPWIYDFAAYDFWLKPYGFLVMLTYLKNKGCDVTYIDCLDKKISHKDFGRGKYSSAQIAKPEVFKNVPRKFKRYGITPEEFKTALAMPAPDYILITSSMTYWYPAIIDAIKILRQEFPEAKIILGGTYATLCYGHAKKNIPCDAVFTASSLKDFFGSLDMAFDEKEFYSTLPDYRHLYPRLEYAVIRTSWGCPFNCSYCAIKLLSQGFAKLETSAVTKLMQDLAKQNVRDFVLYDDAFLYDLPHAKKFLSEVISLGLGQRFHTPNALHWRYLDQEIARLLKRAEFVNPHFGLETLNPELQKQWAQKVTSDDLARGVELLKNAGFKPGEFSAYLLLGYPGQNLRELKKEADFLHSLGVKVSLAEFSPVPGTALFEQYGKNFSEPLLQNNSVFSSLDQTAMQEIWEVKNYVRELNKAFIENSKIKIQKSK